MKDVVYEYLSRNKTDCFGELLFKYIDMSGLTDSEVYKKANVDRRVFSKIRCDSFVPNKKVIIRLCFVLKLNLKKSINLLESAGYSFSSSSKRDLVIKFCLENSIYDIFIVNDLLYSFSNTIL